MVVDIKKVLVCDAVDKACIELLESNGISVNNLELNNFVFRLNFLSSRKIIHCVVLVIQNRARSDVWISIKSFQ